MLSAAQWNLMREADPHPIMKVRTLMVSAEGQPVKKNGRHPQGGDPFAPSLKLNPMVVDFGVRQTAARISDN